MRIFITLAWIIWEGNVRLLIFLKKNLRLPSKVYYKSILALYAFIILYTGFVATAGLSLWLTFSAETNAAYSNLLPAVIIIIVAALFITNLYEMFYLKAQQQDIEKKGRTIKHCKNT